MTSVAEKTAFAETLVMSTLEEDGQYLRVVLDKSENFKVTAGERLKDMLETKFNGDREALKQWYKDNVETWEGEYFQHRAWSTVEGYMGVVIKHGNNAASKFSELEQRKRDIDKAYREKTRTAVRNQKNQSLSGKSTLPPRETLKPWTPPEETEAQLEEWVATFFDMSRRHQDEGLRRIGAVRLEDAA